MKPALKRVIEGIVGIVVFIIVLRVVLVPAYAFIHPRSETLLVIVITLGAVLALFISYRVVRYIHRYL